MLIGINLLREGLDLPEVSLVAILDADKEGFLRSETSLIQTAGRAARNIDGRVILYADTVTRSIRRALDEMRGGAAIQEEYNRREGIRPRASARGSPTRWPSVYERDYAGGARSPPRRSDEYRSLGEVDRVGARARARDARGGGAAGLRAGRGAARPRPRAARSWSSPSASGGRRARLRRAPGGAPARRGAGRAAAGGGVAAAGAEPASASGCARRPDVPGVYLMRAAGGEVLYVGKAASLRARLRSYVDPARQGPKTVLLVRRRPRSSGSRPTPRSRR